MKNLFEENINELSNLIYIYLSNRSEPNQHLNILDWSDNLLNKEGYDIFFNSTAKDECDCLMPINVTCFDKNAADIEQELVQFNTISYNNIKNNYFDIVLLRKLTKYDNSVIDVINTTARCIKEDGILYFNLILTENIETIFKTALKNGLYPISIASIQINENVRPEFDGREDEEAFKEIIDIHGYIQICFRKRKCSNFYFTELSDKRFHEMNEQSVHYLRLAGVWKIDQAMSNEAYIDMEEMKNWIVSSRIVDVSDVYKCISKIKNSPKYSDTIKIYFSDYFEVDLPKHKSLSELNTNMYYYLSPSLVVHCMIDNIINDGDEQIPELILRKINFNYLGNVYKLIDTSGKVIDSGEKWLVKQGEKYFLKGECDYLEDNAIELNSLNNICGANIDISATLLFNLIRIKPKRKISLIYLKNYFYTTEYNKAIENISSLMCYNKEQYQSRGDLLLAGQDSEFKNVGYYSLLEFCEHHCDSRGENNNDFHTYSIEDIKNAFVYIDDFKNHDSIIDNFILRNDNSIEKFKIMVSKRFADIAFVNNLRKYENKVKMIFDIEELITLLGTEKQLAVAEMNHSILRQNKTKEIKLIDYYVALEKYLRLCLAYSKNRYKLETGCKSLEKIGLFTFGDLCYCCCIEHNKKMLFKNDDKKIDLLLSHLKEIKHRRNLEVHTGVGVNVEDAEGIIEQVYMVLKLLNDMILFDE